MLSLFCSLGFLQTIIANDILEQVIQDLSTFVALEGTSENVIRIAQLFTQLADFALSGNVTITDQV